VPRAEMLKRIIVSQCLHTAGWDQAQKRDAAVEGCWRTLYNGRQSTWGYICETEFFVSCPAEGGASSNRQAIGGNCGRPCLFNFSSRPSRTGMKLRGGTWPATPKNSTGRSDYVNTGGGRIYFGRAIAWALGGQEPGASSWVTWGRRRQPHRSRGGGAREIRSRRGGKEMVNMRRMWPEWPMSVPSDDGRGCGRWKAIVRPASISFAQ